MHMSAGFSGLCVWKDVDGEGHNQETNTSQ